MKPEDDQGILSEKIQMIGQNLAFCFLTPSLTPLRKKLLI